MPTYTRHATARAAALGALPDLRDADAVLGALDALHRLDAGDLRALLGALVADAAGSGARGALLDDVAVIGVRGFAADVLDRVALDGARRDLDGLADRYASGSLQRLAEDIADACDGFDAVGVGDARAWSATLAALAETVEAAGQVLADVDASDLADAARGVVR